MDDTTPVKAPVRNLLLFGATGQVGGACLRALAGEAGHLRPRVRLVVRRPERLPVVDLPIEVRRGGIEDRAFLESVLMGIDAVLLVTGDDRRQVELETQVIEAAARGGRPRIVKISALTAGLDPRVSFGRAHGAIEDRLKASGVPHTVLRPSFFFQSLELFAPTVRRHRRLIVPAADGAIAFVDLRDVGAAAARALLDPGDDGRTYTLTGAQAWRLDEVAGALAARLGHAVGYSSPPLPVARAMMLASGMGWWLSGRVIELFAAVRAAAEAQVADDLNRLLGRPALGLDDYLASSWRSWSRPKCEHLWQPAIRA